MLVAHLHSASAVAPEPAVAPTIAVEAEAGLVGGELKVVDGPGASGRRYVHLPEPAGPPPPGGVRVAGNHLLRDGAPFVPVGFTMVGLVHPTGEGETAWAARRLNGTAMDAAIAWGANTIRFQVSQRGLDPLDALYSDAYVERIVAGVALARSYGLVVVLSVQDQGPSGGDSHPQPSAATIRDWQTLTARFNGDQHVMYEIFNEPQNKPTPDGWEVWRNGGPPEGNQGTPAVGHQRVLDAIRATGATNVVIADAGQFGQRLDGVPLLHDPLGQVAYGVHPYLTHSLREPDDWEPGFGFLSSQYPVVATEWTAVSRVQFCKPEWETTAPQLVDYLQRRNIGMLAWAFDVLDTLILDWPDYTPTSLEGFRCGDFEYGAGELVKAEIPNWRPPVAPCRTGLSDDGVLAVPIEVPADGAYRLWTRVRPTKRGGASLLQVDDRCPSAAWSGLEPGGGWSWSAGPQTMHLTAGRHTLRFLGPDGGANVDRILLTADTGCVPADPSRPCPAPTPVAATTTTTAAATGESSTTSTTRARRPPRRRPEAPRGHRPPARGRRSSL
jgi:hypothetical protein